MNNSRRLQIIYLAMKIGRILRLVVLVAKVIHTDIQPVRHLMTEKPSTRARWLRLLKYNADACIMPASGRSDLVLVSQFWLAGLQGYLEDSHSLSPVHERLGVSFYTFHEVFQFQF